LSNAPTAPNYSPKAKRERAKEYQLDAIAQFSVLGIPSGTIAGITELSETYINRLLRGGQSKKLDELREGYKQQNLKVVAGAHFKLVDMLPEAQDAIQDALGCKDIRVRAENAWKVHDKVVPNLFKDTDKQDSYHITLNQPHVQAQIGETMSSVSKSLNILLSVVRGQDPGQYVKDGTDALPVPPSQLEVEEGEMELIPERTGEDDLLTELVEREE
jgi:hypothetical protein